MVAQTNSIAIDTIAVSRSVAVDQPATTANPTTATVTPIATPTSTPSPSPTFTSTTKTADAVSATKVAVNNSAPTTAAQAQAQATTVQSPAAVAPTTAAVVNNQSSVVANTQSAATQASVTQAVQASQAVKQSQSTIANSQGASSPSAVITPTAPHSSSAPASERLTEGRPVSVTTSTQGTASGLAQSQSQVPSQETSGTDVSPPVTSSSVAAALHSSSIVAIVPLSTSLISSPKAYSSSSTAAAILAETSQDKSTLYVSATTITGSNGVPVTSYSTLSPSSTSSTGAGAVSSQPSTSAKAGIGIAVAIGVGLVVLAVYLFLRRRRRISLLRMKARSETSESSSASSRDPTSWPRDEKRRSLFYNDNNATNITAELHPSPTSNNLALDRNGNELSGYLQREPELPGILQRDPELSGSGGHVDPNANNWHEFPGSGGYYRPGLRRQELLTRENAHEILTGNSRHEIGRGNTTGGGGNGRPRGAASSTFGNNGVSPTGISPVSPISAVELESPLPEWWGDKRDPGWGLGDGRVASPPPAYQSPGAMSPGSGWRQMERKWEMENLGGRSRWEAVGEAAARSPGSLRNATGSLRSPNNEGPTPMIPARNPSRVVRKCEESYWG